VKEPVICHICDFQPEYGGTFVDSLLSLSHYCHTNLGIRTVCIFPERAKDRSWLKQLDDKGIPYAFVPRKRGNTGQHVKSILESYNPLILHSHFFFFDLSAILMKVLYFRNLKVVWHYHSQPSRTLSQKIKNLIKLGLVFGVLGDRCIAVGEGVFRSIQHVGLPDGKAILIHNGVDTNRFIPNSDVRNYARQRLNVSFGTTIFLLLGYAPHIKGVDIFIKAAAEAAAGNEFPKLFVIVGRSETREFVSQLPFASKLGDALLVIDPVEDLSVLLNGVDVLVSASRSEGFGYAVVEAMAAKKLALCSDIDPARQTYGRSQGVWLYPSEDWKMLAKLMENVVLLPVEEKKSLGHANSQYVIENHSLHQWSEKVGDLYKGLLGKCAAIAWQ
jgi:glycosyltransferase involved in cell wall biosynthesis